jgi:hypothetical protein
MFTINPIEVLEMIGVGYVLAVSIHMLLSLWYSRLGRRVLLNGDHWTPTYFILNGIAWIPAVAVAVFETLPLVVFMGGISDAYKLASLLVLALAIMLFRNRRQQPLQQSFAVTMFLTLCIAGGGYLGCVERFAHLH